MKNYTIDWSERKTFTGKDGKDKTVFNCSLKDDEGKVFEKVAIWSDFPNFANLMTGHKVSGNLYTNDKGYVTLYPPKPESAQPRFGRSPGMAAGMMERKEKGIEKFQDNKEHGIKISSTMRDAVLLATAERANVGIVADAGTLADRVLHWRAWLWQHWDDPETSNYGQPF